MGVLHQMTWPPQSPNSNPMGMVWDELDRREKQPASAQHMWEHLLRRNSNIKSIFFWLLHDSMCYFIVLMSSLLFYIVENSKDKEKPWNE
jgi:hypothetical protein